MKFEPRLPRDDVNVSRTHPLQEAARLVAAVALVTVVFVLAAFVGVEIVVRVLPASLEQRLFMGWADGAGRGDARTGATQALVDRLAAHWPENPYQLHVGVMDEETPNAFAAPGGAILVTSGLLESVRSENELAFVLAHEIGHFRGRDHLRALGRGVIVQLTLQGVLAGGASSVPALVSDLTERSFGRDQERDADRFGLGLIAAEYGHTAGADDFFERLPDADADLGDSLGAWFATHPVTEGRIEALGDVSRDRGWARNGELRPLDLGL